MLRLKAILANPLTRKHLVWAALFLAFNLAFEHQDNTNGHSRYALLCALREDRSFQIDRYQGMTVDWARTPDGHYYSNKAPGPVLVAFPVFAVIDSLITMGVSERETRDTLRLRHRYAILKFLSFLFQAIPFAIVSVLWLGWLARAGVSLGGQSVVAAALFYGSTAPLFTNTFFGHGFVAWTVMGALYALFRQRFLLAGLLAGLSVLGDYFMALWLIPFLWVAWRRGKARALVLLSVGGVGPLVMFAIYHSSCFGGAFVLPNRFQNPDFVEASRFMFWGVLNPLPDLRTLGELLVGPSRGILMAVPWIWVTFGSILAAVRRRAGISIHEKEVAIMASVSLLLLLWFNASFNGWHGGNSPGPRYLSAVFPLFAIWLGLRWGAMGRNGKVVVLVALAPSLALYGMVAAFGLWAPPGIGLWPFYLGGFWSRATPTAWLRLVVSFVGVFFVVFRYAGDEIRLRSVH